MASPQTRPLVDRIIPGGLERYLLEARERGDSYQTIVLNLAAEHDITVTPPTVASWCRHYEIEKVEPA